MLFSIFIQISALWTNQGRYAHAASVWNNTKHLHRAVALAFTPLSCHILLKLYNETTLCIFRHVSVKNFFFLIENYPTFWNAIVLFNSSPSGCFTSLKGVRTSLIRNNAVYESKCVMLLHFVFSVNFLSFEWFCRKYAS